MSTVKIDLTDNSRAVYKRGEGWAEVERSAVISGITETGQAQLNAAMTALSTYHASTAIGGAHQYMGGLYLDEISPEAMGPGQVKCRLIYRRMTAAEAAATAGGSVTDEPVLQVGTTAQQIQSDVDYLQRPITLTYTDGVTTYSNTPAGPVPKFEPRTTLHFERTEPASPADKSKLYVGKVNQAGWEFDTAAPARTWFCSSLVGVSNDKGASFRVSYDFEYRDWTWDEIVYYVDPTTGKPPEDIDPVDYDHTDDGNGNLVELDIEGNGWKRWQMYSTANFNDLQLKNA